MSRAACGRPSLKPTLPRVDASGELGQVLADAGGVDAPREWSARLRELLRSELERGARELGEARTGRERPIVVAVGPAGSTVLAVLPLPPELRADPAAVGERGGALAAAAVEQLVEATEPGRPRAGHELALLAGEHDGFLALSYPAGDPRWAAEYAREALDDSTDAIDRLRARTQLLPGHALEATDLRPAIGATHPLRVAEAVTRLGGSPLDEEALERLEPELQRLLEPSG